MDFLDYYLESLCKRHARKRSSPVMEIETLLELEEKDLPRLMELIRIGMKALCAIADAEPEDEYGIDAEMNEAACKAIEKIEELAANSDDRLWEHWESLYAIKP